MLDVAQLTTLFWIARLGSFRAAAARLHLTQPAVSIRIKNMEQDLGLRLFQRTGRSVSLTKDGAEIVEYAERILGLMEEIGRRSNAGDKLRGAIRLGVPDSFAQLCLPDMLNHLDAAHPELNVSVTVEASPILARRLEEGALDVCLLMEPIAARSVRLQRLGIQQQAWVCKPGLLVGAHPYRRDQVANFRIFVNPPPSYTYELLMNWFAEDGIVPSKISTCNDWAAILQLVRSGSGISLVPRSMVADALAKETLSSFRTQSPISNGTMFIASLKTASNRAVFEVIQAIGIVVERMGYLD